MVATMWYVGLNLIGPTLICAVLLVGVIEWMGQKTKHPGRESNVLIAGLGLFVAFLMLSPANLVILEPLELRLKYRRHPDLESFLANYLVLATGLIFGWRLARGGKLAWAVVALTVGTTAIIVEACTLRQRFYR